jgi:hypothetical protein
MTAATAPQPQQQQTPAARPAKFVGLAWSSLILGIVGVVFSPLPIINNVSALIAVVGIILALIALFGSRKILAGSGAALCTLAIVFTVAKQNHDVAALDKAFGHDPVAVKDVAVSGCSVTSEYGLASTHATVKITNSTDRTQSYMATISVNDTNGARIGEINTSSNSLAAGQSVTLTGVAASGTAGTGAQPGPATCVVTNVNRFAS